MANTRCPISVGSRCSTRSARRSSRKQLASRSIRPSALSVAPSSGAPASDVTAPPSNAATPRRPSTLPNSNNAGLHSVGIGTSVEMVQVGLANQLLPLNGPDVPTLREKYGLDMIFLQISDRLI